MDILTKMKKIVLLALFIIALSSETVLAHGHRQSLQQLQDEALGLQINGKHSRSLELWKQLYQRYKQSGQTEQLEEVTIQIARNQKSMGLMVAACYTLHSFLKNF